MITDHDLLLTPHLRSCYALQDLVTVHFIHVASHEGICIMDVSAAHTATAVKSLTSLQPLYLHMVIIHVESIVEGIVEIMCVSATQNPAEKLAAPIITTVICKSVISNRTPCTRIPVHFRALLQVATS